MSPAAAIGPDYGPLLRRSAGSRFQQRNQRRTAVITQKTRRARARLHFLSLSPTVGVARSDLTLKTLTFSRNARRRTLRGHARRGAVMDKGTVQRIMRTAVTFPSQKFTPEGVSKARKVMSTSTTNIESVL